MNIPMIIILAVAGGIIYTFLNIVIRRLIARVRSREDYDEDVDGVMTKKQKEAAKEAKILEAEKLKVGLKEVFEENKVKFFIVSGLGILLGGLVGYKFGLSLNTIIFFLFFALITIIAFVDMATMEIPPALNYAILVLGIASIWINPEITLVQRIIGFVCISGFMLLVSFLVSGAFGGGDMKLMAAAGLLLGWKGILTAFIFGLFLGAAIGVVLLVRKKKGGKQHMPFGPSLCIGLVMSTIFGSQLVDWYINIIKLSMPNTFGS